MSRVTHSEPGLPMERKAWMYTILSSVDEIKLTNEGDMHTLDKIRGLLSSAGFVCANDMGFNRFGQKKGIDFDHMHFGLK